MRSVNKKKIIVALSGGVDSAVAVYLLQKDGYIVHGLHFNFWHWEGGGETLSSRKLDELQKILKIEIKRVSFQNAFKQHIVEDFISSQKLGLTPNPCVRCNPKVKFKLLIEYANQLGIEKVATGHYVRVEFDTGRKCYLLKTAEDLKKDQTYMLSFLNQEILSRSIFPLGNFTKRETYAVGDNLGLPINEDDESQDLCFVKPENYKRFLRDEIGEVKKGKIVNTAGDVVGTHEGLVFYTIGQRKGIKVSAPRALYVIKKDPLSNTLIVGYKEELERKSFQIADPNWICGKMKMPQTADVKIRYQSKRVKSTIRDKGDEKYIVELSKPQLGITPGQYAVFYNRDSVIGGGKIIG